MVANQMETISAPASSTAAVQVYARIRPLIPEEEGHDRMDYKIHRLYKDDDSMPADQEQQQQQAVASLHIKQPSKKRNMNPAFFRPQKQTQEEENEVVVNVLSTEKKTTAAAATAAPPRFLLQGRDEWKEFHGYTDVLDSTNTNEMVYKKTIQALGLPKNVIQDNKSVCIFTYGHSGSGKTHTLLGYDGKQDSLGIYKYAVHDLFAQMKNVGSKDRLLLVRISELYKDKARDLLTGDECTIREDKQGVCKVRGPMIEDEEGKIDQKPLGKLCRTANEVIDCVDAACTSRHVGTSTHHDQSSRSHLVLELEVVTEALVEQRNLAMVQEAELTRLKWLQFERMFRKHIDRPLPKWTDVYTASSMKLRTDIRTLEGLVEESQAKLHEMEQDLGGTLVFCDLAGNEYARDAAGSTKEEMEEAAEINKSLLAVKEMIRSLNHKSISSNSSNSSNNKNTKKQHNHVAYRDSKLSMMLRRHLAGQDGEEDDNSTTRAIMMGHISPSQEYIRKTMNTMTYCSMVVAGKNNGSNTAGSRGKIKTHKKKPISNATAATIAPPKEAIPPSAGKDKENNH